MNCQSTPLSGAIDTREPVPVQNLEVSEPICAENNTGDGCELELTVISYDLPDTPCEPFENYVRIDTRFFAPAGLHDGSLSRLDWEFLPNGNAGFWFTGIDQEIDANTGGIIQMAGCFSYGNQQTLKITRIIEDQNGNLSNTLSVEIPNPVKSKIAGAAPSNFMVLNDYFNE
jgi:hypothetical protein